jgi:methanogenic corrinoid protein MtbC1
MWEKRYGILAPDRSATNRRQFSEEDIERLRLLAQATENGHRIGDISHLSDEELSKLGAKEAPAISGPEIGVGADESRVRAALQATYDLNEQALRTVIELAVTDLGHQGMLSRVIAPLLEEIGNAWATGRFRPMHEHFAVATLRSVLAPSKPFAPNTEAPWIVCATPLDQLHEMGALLTAAVAGNQGWRVLYLGANLPAVEIIAACKRVQARALCLSIVHPGEGSELGNDLKDLRKGLKDSTAILVGGRGATSPQLAEAMAAVHYIPNLDELVTQLQSLWVSPPTGQRNGGTPHS